MTTFDKTCVIECIQATLPKTAQKAFVSNWETGVRYSGSPLSHFCSDRTQVKKQVEQWILHRKKQHSDPKQLEFEAHVVQYVKHIANQTRVHGLATSIAKTAPRPLAKGIPLYGPHFKPPTFLDKAKRSAVPKIEVETAYLKAVTIVHPFYFPQLSKCPRCSSENIKWDGWTTSGHRDVHGLRVEETALGCQLLCQACLQHGGPSCFATTNPVFWDLWEHWRIPSKLPLK